VKYLKTYNESTLHNHSKYKDVVKLDDSIISDIQDIFVDVIDDGFQVITDKSLFDERKGKPTTKDDKIWQIDIDHDERQYFRLDELTEPLDRVIDYLNSIGKNVFELIVYSPWCSNVEIERQEDGYTFKDKNKCNPEYTNKLMYCIVRFEG
jgi:hypothetical protein